MKSILLPFLLLFSISVFAQVNIVPKPVSVEMKPGTKEWKNGITVVAVSPEEKQVAELLKEFLRQKNIISSIQSKATGENVIILSIGTNDGIGTEGYRLQVNKMNATINANTGAGLFYGVQSFLQLFQNKSLQTPLVSITDYPRFTYRGLHLDVGRHMFSPSFIKKYIDLLAAHKMNRFHWHLTEDQGWRIEIKKYPRLHEVGGYRKETAIGKATTKTRAQVKYDGKPYGGYYTQDEIKEIVQYASARHVMVIPEIELPGHAMATLAGYPNLGCTGGSYETATTWGVFTDVYCAGKEETFTFLQDVFDEVLTLFPSPYIHIGGDECPKTKWETCPNCQKRIVDEKLKDEHQLQSYFIQRIEKYLNSKGRQIIGWDEILEGGLAPNATVMSWRGEDGGIAAARQNHNVIMTPGQWCYLDYAQDTSKAEPLSIGGFTPVSKVYSYEPVPPQLSSEEAKHILGAQCNVWTEYMKTPEHVEYMVYPRAIAMAEVLWSTKEARSYTDFLGRMKFHLPRLKEKGVNYARHIEEEF
jgi:hexosaminidase